MKFNRISDDRLQIIITSEDLRQRNMKKMDLMPYNLGAQELFREILQKAAQVCGFYVQNDTQLMVEAYPINGDSLIMSITKLEEGEKTMNPNLQVAELIDTMKHLVEKEEASVYRFDDLEHVIEACEEMAHLPDLPSRLYKDHDGDYLLRLQLSEFNQQMTLYGRLVEYGVLVPLTEAYLNEHATCIIEEKAIRKLSGI